MIVLQVSHEIPVSHFRQMVGFAFRSPNRHSHLGLPSKSCPLRTVRVDAFAVAADAPVYAQDTEQSSGLWRDPARSVAQLFSLRGDGDAFRFFSGSGP